MGLFWEQACPTSEPVNGPVTESSLLLWSLCEAAKPTGGPAGHFCIRKCASVKLTFSAPTFDQQEMETGR